MSVNSATVVNFEDARLEAIKRRIEAAQKRAKHEWVEGSIELMLAVREAKSLLQGKLVEWLSLNIVGIGTNYTAGLLYLSADIDLARKVLSDSPYRNYYRIWAGVREQYRHCLPESVVKVHSRPRGALIKNATVKRGPKPGKPRFGAMIPRPRNSISNLFRIQKLGADVIEKIKDTSLGYAKELDELVILNGGAEPGQLTPIVAQLVADAVAGKHVSALAIASKVKRPDLQQAWVARMVLPWQVASYEERHAFTLWLINELGDQPPKSKEKEHE